MLSMKDFGYDSFKKQDAVNRPKWVINKYINSAKCGADLQDASEYIAQLASVGGHDEKELYDYFVAQMQHWGKTFTRKRKTA